MTTNRKVMVLGAGSIILLTCLSYVPALSAGFILGMMT